MSIVSAVDPHLRPPRRRVTVQEWLAIPEEKRAEVIDGKLVYHAMPGPKHGTTQSGILSFVRSPRRSTWRSRVCSAGRTPSAGVATNT
jgi:Uma2 family endonuclease